MSMDDSALRRLGIINAHIQDGPHEAQASGVEHCNTAAVAKKAEEVHGVLLPEKLTPDGQWNVVR